jgi:amidase
MDQPQPTMSVPASKWDYCTITELVADLRLRKVSALEVLDHTIARLEALDGRLNAVVVRDFDRAREAAKAADTALAHGDHRPLLGVPTTIKEAFNIAGLPTTWGSSQFEHFVPPDDALVVSRLKSAGAVILGKTNVPLALADFQSYNDVYGTTKNPWDVGRSPGGSSGGPLRHWPRASARCRSVRTSAAHYVFPRTSAGSTPTSRASVWCQCAATTHPRWRRCLGTAIWPFSAR